MTTPAEWLESTARYCPCGTLVLAWNGAKWVVARCPKPHCRMRGTCPDCRTGHDTGKCAAVDAA